MSAHPAAKRVLIVGLIGLASVAQADTWVCTQSSGHRIVASVNPTLPHWECKASGGATRLSTQKLNSDCVAVAPIIGASCNILTDSAMGLRVGMTTREVMALYGAPQAREHRRVKDGLALVWLYESRPGPRFEIVYRDLRVSEWGLAQPDPAPPIRVTQEGVRPR